MKPSISPVEAHRSGTLGATVVASLARLSNSTQRRARSVTLVAGLHVELKR